ETGGGLVVDEDIPPVVGAILVREMHVVRVTGDAVFEQLLGEVGAAPAGGGVPIEHGNALQLAHAGDADHADLAALSAAPEAIVFIQSTGRDMGLGSVAARVGRRAGADFGHARGPLSAAAGAEHGVAEDPGAEGDRGAEEGTPRVGFLLADR